MVVTPSAIKDYVIVLINNKKAKQIELVYQYLTTIYYYYYLCRSILSDSYHPTAFNHSYHYLCFSQGWMELAGYLIGR